MYKSLTSTSKLVYCSDNEEFDGLAERGVIFFFFFFFSLILFDTADLGKTGLGLKKFFDQNVKKKYIENFP